MQTHVYFCNFLLHVILSRCVFTFNTGGGGGGGGRSISNTGSRNIDINELQAEVR